MMKTTVVAICLVLMGMATFNASPLCAGTIQWLTYDDAQKRGQGQERKYLLYFQTERCRFCRKLEEETLSDKAVAAYINDHYIPVRIDTDKSPRVAASHGIRGVPDLHFLSPRGDNIANWPGFIEVSRLLPLLRYIHTDSYLTMSYAQFLADQKP